MVPFVFSLHEECLPCPAWLTTSIEALIEAICSPQALDEPVPNPDVDAIPCGSLRDLMRPSSGSHLAAGQGDIGHRPPRAASSVGKISAYFVSPTIAKIF